MTIRRFFLSGTCLLALAIALPAHANSPRKNSPTLYVVETPGVGIVKASKRTEITGRNTKLTSPWGIARQALGDLVISNRELSHSEKPGRIVTLPAGKGNVTAKYVLQCKDFAPGGIAVDKDSNIWMTDYDSGAGGDVRAYPANATGCPAPLFQITGPHTQLNQPTAVAIDSKGRIIVANYLVGLTIYAPGSNGDVAPIATIKDSDTENSHIEGMTVDNHDNIWVTSYANASVLEFAPDANGNVAPIRKISGDRTQLDAPIGLAVDRKTGNIYVAAYGNAGVLEFAADAQGNVAPISTISGFTSPWGVVLH
jgi:sugar lactone lactonase YvrE